MRVPVRRAVLGTAVALAAAGAFRLGTTAPVRVARGEDAVVRLSWSARPERVEQCRRLTDEELAARPAHMRMRLECEGSFARYLLTLAIDGRRLPVDTVRGGGLRHDRPIHLFEEYRVPAGTRRLQLTLARIDSATATAATDSGVVPADTLLGQREAREVDERRRRAAEAIPALLALDTVLTIAPRRVLLVTYDGARRTLVARMEP